MTKGRETILVRVVIRDMMDLPDRSLMDCVEVTRDGVRLPVDEARRAMRLIKDQVFRAELTLELVPAEPPPGEVS